MKLDELLVEADWSDVMGGGRRRPGRVADPTTGRSSSGKPRRYGKRHIPSDATDGRLSDLVVGRAGRDEAAAESVGAADFDPEVARTALRVYRSGPQGGGGQLAEYLGGNVMGLAQFASERMRDAASGDEQAITDLRGVVMLLVSEMPKVRARIRKASDSRGMQSDNWAASEEVQEAVAQMQATFNRSVKTLQSVQARENRAEDPRRDDPPGGGLEAIAREKRGTRRGFNS